MIIMRILPIINLFIFFSFNLRNSFNNSSRALSKGSNDYTWNRYLMDTVITGTDSEDSGSGSTSSASETLQSQVTTENHQTHQDQSLSSSSQHTTSTGQSDSTSAQANSVVTSTDPADSSVEGTSPNTQNTGSTQGQQSQPADNGSSGTTGQGVSPSTEAKTPEVTEPAPQVTTVPTEEETITQKEEEKAKVPDEQNRQESIGTKEDTGDAGHGTGNTVLQPSEARQVDIQEHAQPDTEGPEVATLSKPIGEATQLSNSVPSKPEDTDETVKPPETEVDQESDSLEETLRTRTDEEGFEPGNSHNNSHNILLRHAGRNSNLTYSNPLRSPHSRSITSYELSETMNEDNIKSCTHNNGGCGDDKICITTENDGVSCICKEGYLLGNECIITYNSSSLNPFFSLVIYAIISLIIIN